jgi:[ribosomal protein S18]-alanine N-acetyltransferase
VQSARPALQGKHVPRRGGKRKLDPQSQPVEVRTLTCVDVAAIASWRYPDRYATYDVDDPATLATDHWAVTEAGELIGYCCFGGPARVGGAVEAPGALDVGYGLAPNRMGRGMGDRFVTAILEFAREYYAPERFRVHILEWNERSRKVAERQGFAVEATLKTDEGLFLVMARPVQD